MSSALEAWKKRADDAAALQKEARNKQAVVTPKTSKQERLNSWEQRVEQVKSAYARPTDVVKRSYYRNEDGSMTAAEDMVDPRTKRNALEKQQETAALRKREREKAEFTKTAQELNRLNRSGGAKDLNLQKELKEKKDDLRGDTGTRFGKGLQSIGLSAPATIEYLGESTLQARENAADYQNSEWKAQADAALNAIKLARTLYGEGSEEHLKAQADYNALRENIAAYQTAPERAVDMDSRAAQFMGGVQQLQEEALEGTSGVGRFLGEAALSIGSNLAKLPLNAVLPGASLALMGAEAAANKAYELGQRGVSAGEALTRGALSGGIEALTEKIPLDNLMDIIKSGSKAGLMTLVKQAATEGGEEGVAYLLNLLADKAAGDQEAQFELREFAKSIGMGALSGGILGGGATLLNRAGNVTAANDPAEQAVQMLLRGEEISGKQAKRIMESDSAIAALQEAAGITINRNAPASQVKAQIRSVGRDRAANTGAPVQTPGQAEMPVQPAGAVLEEAAMEMAEEQTRKETNVREAIANRSAMPYTETRQNTEGGMNGGEEVSLRESSQWNDRADPGREVPRMEEGAGRDPGGQDPRFRPKDGGAAGLRIEKQVSTAALGIGGGASNDGVYVVSGGDTEATAKARTLAKERGLRLTLFTGGNLHINGEECRAYITGDRVFVRADHNEFDAYQLIRHEAGHDRIAKGEIDIKAAIENVRTRLGDEGSVTRAVQTYASAFAGADMTVDEALEEIICDSLGDMNVFSGTEVEAEFSEVLDEARAAAGESRVESKTGPPVEGKASREHWRTDLNKQQFQELMKAVRQDAKVSRNNISENANWLFTNVGDTPVFSIYSTLDQNEPTVLYEVKGEQAEFENNALNDVLEAIKHGKSVDGKSNDVSAVLSRGWVRGSGSDINGSGGAGRRSDSGNAGVLRQQPQRHTSAAFESILRNLFQVQETESVKSDLAALGVEEVKGTVDSASRDAKREDVLRAVEQLLQEYGAIEPGENPFRSVQVPKQTGEGKNVSKTVRTILEAEATPEAIIPNIEELVADGALSFESYTDEQAIADATAKLQGKGWSKTLSNWLRDMDKGIVNKKNTVTGWALYNNAANSGDTETALTILEKMVGHQRNAAQALQATRVLKKLSPEAQLYGVQRSIEDLQEELNDRYGQDKAPKLKVDPELGEKFLRAKTDKERDDALGEIYRDVGRQIPSRFRDKWNAWRYLAMLGNPRTHVRNVVGNAGFAPLVAAKNLTATAIESAVSRVSGGKVARTKAFVGAGRQDRELLRAAWSDFANVEEAVSGEGKYTDLQQENKQVREGQAIFKNKLLEKARKKNSEWMEREDTWFSQPHYAAALAGYCKANGITAQQIAVGEGLDKARAYAVKEAQKATYRDSNYLSQVFGEIGGRWRYDKRNPLKRGVGMLVEGILPFRKTPANILARGVEYSPIGLMNGIKKAVWDVQNEKATAAEAIDNISAGLTGTGLMALGVFLAAQGLVRGRGEDDEKEKTFAELQGHQAYSMELPNGTSVTLDWLAPEALPFFVGVNFWEMTEGDAEEVNMESILGAVTSVTEPLMEMSCLQSLNDLFDSVGYASSNDLNSLMSVLVSAATSYVTQAIPTLGGQIERSMQRERMTTYTDKNKWISTDMQYAIGSATSRIPGIDYGQIPYIDAWGRAESTGGLAENAFNNLINPSYTSRIDTSAMEEELLRLYRATGESVFPGRAARYFYVNGDRKDLTAEEYVQYATRKGQISFEMLTELVNSSTYKQLSDVEKAKMVSEVYTNANQQAKSEVSDYEADDWAAKYLEAEKKYGIKQETFAEVRMRTRFLSSLKDQSGETIDNSLSLLKMEAVYEMPGLTDKQRQALFEYLGVGKTVRHYNKSLVQSKLKSMRKKAK